MNRSASFGMILSVKNPWELTTTELKSISKGMLLKYFTRSLHMVYDRLPENLQQDSEIQSYLPCLEHWNTPDLRTHIDGIAPSRRMCEKCQLKMWVEPQIVEGVDENKGTY